MINFCLFLYIGFILKVELAMLIVLWTSDLNFVLQWHPHLDQYFIFAHSSFTAVVRDTWLSRRGEFFVFLIVGHVE